jgi:hypothetical protein
MVFEFGDYFALFFGLLLGFGFGFYFLFHLGLGFGFDLFFSGGFFFSRFFLVAFLIFLVFRFFVSLLLSWFILIVVGFVWSSELSWHVSDTGPVFDNLPELSSHFDEESSVENLLVVMVSDEVDGIDSHLKDNFERSWVVIFNFDEIEFGESFSDVVFCGIEITLDQVEGDMIDFLIKVFD